MAFDDTVVGAAANSKIIEVALRDSTTGQLKASVAYGSVAYSFIREGDDANKASGTCVDMTLDTYTDHGWKETGIAGIYQFGVPQAALATGKNAVTIKLVVSGAIDVVKRILIDARPSDTRKVLGTALTESAGGGKFAGAMVKFFNVATPTGTINSLPDAVPGAANGLLISGTNSGATVFGSGSTVTFTTLAVTGTLSANAVSVATTTTLSGNVSCGAAFDIVGAFTCNSFATDLTFAVGSAFSVGTTTTLTGAVALGASLAVATTTTFTGVVTATAANDIRGVKIGGVLATALDADGTAGDQAKALSKLLNIPVASQALTSAMFGLTAADTGATYVARAPSGTETLDTLHADIAAIGLIGQSVPHAVEAATITIGTQETATYAKTTSHDDDNWVLGEVDETPGPGGLDVTVTHAASTTTQIPTMLHVTGYYAGSATHSIAVQIYNYALAAWETVGTMLSRSTPFDYTFPMTSDNQKAADGEMKARFLHNTVANYIATHRLYLDWISFDKQVSDSETASALAAVKAKTDQLQFTLGNVHTDVKALDGTLIDGTATYIAAAFKAQYNIALPVFTNASVNQTADVGTRVPQAITMAQIGGAGVWYVLTPDLEQV